jgi:site-specific recombinase XerC
MLTCELRLSELLGLAWDSVDTDSGVALAGAAAASG